MGRGRSKGGESLGGGSGKDISILNATDVWSYRHRQGNEAFVDEINGGVRRIQEDFPGVMDTVQSIEAATFGGRDGSGVLGVWSSDGRLAIAKKYTDVERMNDVYDRSGDFHPSRGNRSGVEAVTLHEMGHALTDHISQSMGDNIDGAAKTIVDRAYKASGGTDGTKRWAKGISGYAQENNAECVAEAVADWYCNGSKAASQSKAIMEQLRKAYNG